MAEVNTSNIGFEKQIWDAACVLRGNLDASEYKSVVLGLIFLRYAYSRFKTVEAEILKNRPMRGGKAMPVEKSDFAAKSALFLPKEAQYDYLLNLPEDVASANIKDKETLEQLSTATEEKLNGIKNKDQDTENAIKQEAVNRYRQQVDSITNRRKGILESIVTRMATSIVKEESVLEQFKLESGKLNMQKIIDTSEVMYTFLEMVNTLQIKDVDSAYLQEVLTSVQ